MLYGNLEIVKMRLLVALLLLAPLAACQVTTSQSLGNGGVTIRHDVPLEGQSEAESGGDAEAQEGEDADVQQDPKPALTIGGGFSTGVNR